MIPVYTPFLKGNEKKYVKDCLDTSWISSRGKYIDLFESAFARYIGVDGAVAVSNGTMALHLALLSLGIKEGDEVVVPTFTYIATVNAIRYVGAVPVFVDARLDTWQMDHQLLEAKIGVRTKAILITHLYGHPCEMDTIMMVAGKYKIPVIEDCAEAIGSKYKGRYVGGFGDIAAFSFYGNKTITTGEGGMLLSNNKDLLEKAYHMKMQGVSKEKQYWHDIIGYNYKMTNIAAAIGLAQFEQIDRIIQLKLKIAKWYQEMFDRMGISYQRSQENVLNTYWMFSILLDSEKERDALRSYLHEKGIETRPTFFPAHIMPMYGAYDTGDLKTAEFIGLRGINLPSSPSLKKDQIVEIGNTIAGYFKK